MKYYVYLLLLLGCMLTVHAACAEDELTMLHTEGQEIVNAAGESVMLRGVNVGGWLVQEGWMNLTNASCQTESFKVLDERFGREVREHLFKVYEDNYLTEADFDNIRALGMNVIRLPFAWWNILNDDGTLKEDAFARLDWLVENCAKRGLYVILDLHAARGSQNNQDNSGEMNGSQLWENETYQDQMVYLWECVAAHYNGNPAVAAYDLLNEPGGDLKSTGVVQWEYFDRLYEAIRSVDDEHMIMVESCWDPEDLPAPERYDWENVVYQYHWYKWNADNDYWAQKLNVDVKLHKMAKTSHPVPGFLGEFTLFQSLDAWEYALRTYSEAGLGWTIWTYKVTGNSTWGLYNVFGEKADIYQDSAEEIERKWRLQGTVRRNNPICQIVADVLAGKPVELPAESAEISDIPAKQLVFANVEAQQGASVREKGDGYCLKTSVSQDPGEKVNAIMYKLEESVDCTPYTYLTFYIQDLQGSNTHKVTLKDAEGKSFSTWVDIPSVYKQWTRINVPLSMFSSIDLGKLTEICIGEWNSGEYLFDRLFLCCGAMDEPS